MYSDFTLTKTCITTIFRIPLRQRTALQLINAENTGSIHVLYTGMYESQAITGSLIYDIRLHFSPEAIAEAYLASDRVTVYSNHKMLGIRLVSRTRKYSEIGLSNQSSTNVRR